MKIKIRSKERKEKRKELKKSRYRTEFKWATVKFNVNKLSE